MKIQVQETVVLAEVEISDEYGVELSVSRRRTSLTPEQACVLGRELWRAGNRARSMAREDVGGFVAPVAVSGEQVL